MIITILDAGYLILVNKQQKSFNIQYPASSIQKMEEERW